MASKSLLLAGSIMVALPAMAEEHIVQLIDHAFVPAHITIQVGDSVRFTYPGGMPHNARADDDSFRCSEECGVPSGEPYGGLGPGAPSASIWSSSRVFSLPGTVPYFCEVHGAPGGVGMAGSITVLPAQGPGDPPAFEINYGVSGPWFNPAMSGQGFVIEVVPNQEPPQIFLTWFTFRSEPGGREAQRWFTAQGTFEPPTDRVELLVLQTLGGAFGQAEPAAQTNVVGTAELRFHSCVAATISFEMMPEGDAGPTLSGSIPIQRLSPDVLCEELASP
ncbi:MAG TPA: plastocyanin/azurin family copper-binding protein [Xanthomonadaceae bacterium]|nr:plastocyanin/azurin family copper-binding protein [Xanthomonadaceae bacterium]